MMFDIEKYRWVKNRLKLNFRDDEKARDVLDCIIKDSDYSQVERLVKNKTVFVFGCGPSLKGDVKKVVERNLHDTAVVIAADGAVKALLENGVKPDICVADLDGDLKALQKAGRMGCLMVVHAHGDNIRAIKEVIPKLPGMKLGTTQVKPTRKIRNFGGFTDGDRAVYLAVHFKAKRIVLFGMDFRGTTGNCSIRVKNSGVKQEKLEVGRILLEELAGRTPIPMVNATGGGVDLRNTLRSSAGDLELP